LLCVLLPHGAAAAGSPGRQVIAEANRIVDNVKYTSFSERGWVSEEKGDYVLSDAALVSYVLQRVVPRHYWSVRVAPSRLKPNAMDFHEYFNGLDEGGRGGWKRVAHLADARPGDVMAWRRTDSSSLALTHVAIVASEPTRAGERLLHVHVIDSVRYDRHGKDTRAKGQTGVGRGSMYFEIDAEGRPNAYRWATPRSRRRRRSIVVGRPVAFPESARPCALMAKFEACGGQAAPNLPARNVIEGLCRVLLNARHSSYSLRGRVVPEDGRYELSGSGLVRYLLRLTNERHYWAVPVSPGKLRPYAPDFHEFIAGLSAVARGDVGWQRIERLADAKPGDLIAWVPLAADTRRVGHIVIVVGFPRMEAEGQFHVKVADSARSPHGEDTRRRGQSGIGVGLMWFSMDERGRAKGYRWSRPDGPLKVASIAVGRLVPFDVPEVFHVVIPDLDKFPIDQAATPAAAKLARELQRLLLNAKTTRYSHRTRMDESKGDYQCDCSGLVGYVLRRALPRHYKTIKKGKGRPLAIHYYQRFVRAPATEKGLDGWRRVLSPFDAGPGDIIAWQAKDFGPGDNTGHVVLVAGVPERTSDGQARVAVVDSTGAPHSEDTRQRGASGIGRGIMWFTVDEQGRLAGRRWRRAKGKLIEGSMAIGRPVSF